MVEQILLGGMTVVFFGCILRVAWWVDQPSETYSPNDPRLNVACPECGCDDIIECGHHD